MVAMEIMEVASRAKYLQAQSQRQGGGGTSSVTQLLREPTCLHAILLRYSYSWQFVLWLKRAINGEIGNINWMERACTSLICSFPSAGATKLSRVALRAALFLCIGFERLELFQRSPLQVNEKSVQQYSTSSRNYMQK